MVQEGVIYMRDKHYCVWYEECGYCTLNREMLRPCCVVHLGCTGYITPYSGYASKCDGYTTPGVAFLVGFIKAMRILGWKVKFPL